MRKLAWILILPSVFLASLLFPIAFGFTGVVGDSLVRLGAVSILLVPAAVGCLMLALCSSLLAELVREARGLRLLRFAMVVSFLAGNVLPTGNPMLGGQLNYGFPFIYESEKVGCACYSIQLLANASKPPELHRHFADPTDLPSLAYNLAIAAIAIGVVSFTISEAKRAEPTALRFRLTPSPLPLKTCPLD